MNAKQPLKDVFLVEQKAASFMIRHPDYLEGVRAQILEKDHRPQWNPGTIEKVEDFNSIFG
jgi:enoyl-CoA hydratase